MTGGGDRSPPTRLWTIAGLGLLLMIGRILKSDKGGPPAVSENRASTMPYVVAWLVLLLLTGASLLSAYSGLGVLAPIVQFGLAATQATMILVLFMRLRSQPGLNWLFAGAGFVWLFFLYALSLTDYATRHGWP